MEGYAVVAEHLPDSGGYDVISNFQGPFSLHPVMARALRMPGNRLRHRSPPNSGGSFGSKLALFPYIVVLCICARIAGRPVKWIEDRLEHLAAASAAPNRVTRVEAAYDDEGVVGALRLTHWDDHGAYLRAPMPAPIYRMHGLSTNAYAIKHVDVFNHILMTNKCPTGAVTRFWGTPALLRDRADDAHDRDRACCSIRLISSAAISFRREHFLIGRRPVL